MSKKTNRALPVFIAFICLVAAILTMVLPFMYASLNKTNILGFCLIFGGKYTFESNTFPVSISFNWALFFAWLFVILSGVYSFFVCRKTNKANSIITFLVLLTSTILFCLSQRFCSEVISGNVGYINTTYISCGPYIVASLCGIGALLALIDVCKKR